MIIIYDFDGTLTPFSLPQYEILKKCGYTGNKLQGRLTAKANEKNISLYDSYYETFKDVLDENNILMTDENISLGAENVQFNPGVIDYFEYLKSNNPQVKHYVLTSGFEEYVCNTKIAPFMEKIYGVTYHKNNGIYSKIDRLVIDKLKSEIIEDIIQKSNDKNAIYIGDGMTDKYALEYVHNIGGASIYVGSSDDDFNNYNKLKKEGIVDKYFIRDYSKNSELRKFILEKINEET